MANVLPLDKKTIVVHALAEGNSIRSIERMTGIHRDTIMRLGVTVGKGCADIQDNLLRNLPSTNLQLDEIWGFVGKKQKNVRRRDPREMGDVWTFVAIDADTKLVPCYRIGKRNLATAQAFMSDLANRLLNRPQISTDALPAYREAVDHGFGGDVDYGQVVKNMSTADESEEPEKRYVPQYVVSVEKTVVTGNPNRLLISTSFIERQNLTMRMHMRRLTRLTNAYSKKLENFEAAMALHFAYYNFCKVHSSLRCAPAMESGVANRVWSVGDLVALTA